MNQRWLSGSLPVQMSALSMMCLWQVSRGAKQAVKLDAMSDEHLLHVYYVVKVLRFCRLTTEEQIYDV